MIQVWLTHRKWISAALLLATCGWLVLATRNYAATSWIPVQATFRASAVSELTLVWGSEPDQQIALIPDAASKRHHTVRIRALAQRNSAASGHHVRVLQIVDETLKKTSFNAMQLSDGWQLRESPIFTGSNASSLRWSGTTNGKVSVTLATGRDSGIVDVTIDGTKRRVDLYSAVPGTLVVGGASPHNQTWRGILPPVAIQQLTLICHSPQQFELTQLVLDTRVIQGHETTIEGAAMPRIDQAGSSDMVLFQSKLPLGVNAPLNAPWQLLGYWLVPALLVWLTFIGFVPQTLREHPSALLQRTREGRRLIALVCLLIIALYVVHSVTVPIIYSGGDTGAFLDRAGALVERGSFNFGSYIYDMNKLPGYALLYALVIVCAGYNLSALVVIQHLLFCIGLWLLGRGLLHYVPPRRAAICVVLIALSPVQLFYNSTLLSESMMVAWTLCGLGCLLEVGVAVGRREWAWLLCFALAVAVASTARINSLFLCLGLMPLYFQRLRIHATTWRAAFARAAVVAVIALLPTVAWSARNYVTWGVFEPQDLRGIQSFQGALVGGVFDSQVEVMRPYYVVFNQIVSGGGVLAWPLRDALFAEHPNPSPIDQRAVARGVDSTLQRIANESIKRHQLLYTAAMLRSFTTGLWLPDLLDASNEWRNGPHSYGYPDETTTRYFEATLHADYPTTRYDVRTSNGWLRQLFDHWNATYLWYYRITVLIAVCVSMLHAWHGRAHALVFAPLLVFIANMTFMALLLTPYGRYLQVLDFLCITQIALALPIQATRLPRESVV